MTAYFVTATGTDIGKTFVTAGLIRHGRVSGRLIQALKPVATGYDPANPAGSDPAVLLAALGRTITQKEIECIAPWRYAAPLSPDMAAQREGQELDFGKLVRFCHRAIAATPDVLLIEGIGGVMVPLDECHTVADWMVALDIPLVLVAGSYLGSISHTLTSLDVIARRNLTLKAIVINETLDSTVPLADTVATLARFVATTPIVTIHRQAAAEDEIPAIRQIATLL